MTIQVEGGRSFRKRLAALGDTSTLLREIQLRGIHEAKLLVRRKTGHLGRSIVPGPVTRSNAILRANANYAAYVELGTKPHVIKPRRAKALAWPAAGQARLSGRARKGAKLIFARLVHHPGTKAQPYLLPGVRKAIADTALARGLIERWNRAG